MMRVMVTQHPQPMMTSMMQQQMMVAATCVNCIQSVRQMCGRATSQRVTGCFNYRFVSVFTIAIFFRFTDMLLD